MRVFALSDLHVDYGANARWVEELSTADYTEDLLILAGDLTDIIGSLEWCLGALAARFEQVLFVPGNHDLWVARDSEPGNSLEKLEKVRAIAAAAGVSMTPLHRDGLSIYPLLGWYDYSFGEPSRRLKALWTDYRACYWPAGFDEPAAVTRHMVSLNEAHLPHGAQHPSCPAGLKVITFSHFVPRADLIPPGKRLGRFLHPILGSEQLERQLRRCHSRPGGLHVFGHHHINRSVQIDGVTYINNALGYPTEQTGKRLLCIHEY
jgi:predicted phosphodiesterase